MIGPTGWRDRRRPRAGRGRRLLALAALVVLVFAAGVALGEALHDNPKSGITATRVRTVRP